MRKYIPPFLLLLLFIAGSVMGQLNQSGGSGSSVSIVSALPAGSNIIGNVRLDQTTPGTTNGMSENQINGTTIAAGNGVSGLGVQRIAITSDNTPFTVNTIPKTQCGNGVASVPLSAVPTSITLATTGVTTCVVAIIMNNTTASQLTVSVTDNQGSPITDVLPFGLPPFSQLIQPMYGVAFTSGVKWAASGAGVTGAIIGYQ